MNDFENIINTAWDNRDQVNSKSDQSIIDAIKETIKLVDAGKIRVAEKNGKDWVVHQWIKKAILLSFKVNEMQTLAGPYATWWDKVRGKTAGWGREEHMKAGFRMVPNGVVRQGSFIGKNVVLMPSFVNIGAHDPTVTQVSTIVPSSTYAPIFTKEGIKTTFFPMKDPCQTTPLGTILKPAFICSSLPQPAVFPLTLSHHVA